MVTRDQLVNALVSTLQPDDRCRAAWLGGSDATGRADDLSDIDLMLIVSPGAVEPAAALIESAVRTVTPIRHALRLHMPTWHGFHQAFYQLENAPEHLMVDWLIIESFQPHSWLEVERHGTPRVLFDKDRLVVQTHVDQAAILAATSKKVAELRVKFPIFTHLPAKLVRRELPADAVYFYHALVLRPLVDVLRCLYCPNRWDYGFRYIRDDLPQDSYDLIVRLAYPSTPDDIEPFTREAITAFNHAIHQWDAR